MFHEDVCYKSLASQMLLNEFKEMEITGLNTASRTFHSFCRQNWEVMDHTPYSSDLVPGELHRFGPLKEQLTSKRVLTGNDRKQAVTSLLHKNQHRFHLRQDTSHCATVRRKLTRQRVVSTLTSDVYSLLLVYQTYMDVRINLATKHLFPSSFLKALYNNNTVRERVRILRDIMWRSTSTGSNSITLNPITLNLRLLMSYIYIYIYIEHLFLMFLDHTQRRATVGRTPLDE